MKLKIALRLLLATFAVVLFSPPAKAQMDIGGDDVLVKRMSFQSGNSDNIFYKMAVADNGWIYVMLDLCRAYPDGVSLYRSKDGGATYQKLGSLHTLAPYGSSVTYCDFTVTGKDEDDINVWTVMATHDLNGAIGDGFLLIHRHDADFKNTECVYKKDFPDHRLEGVAISSNYRAPSLYGFGGDPFALAVAVSGYGNNQYSFLDYIFSLDGGVYFQQERIYTRPGERVINRVDLSLGSTSPSLGFNTWPLMGVVFEMNQNSDGFDIGFISNFVDYDPRYAWSEPIIIEEDCGWTDFNPFGALSIEIQMMLDDNSDNTVDGKRSHNFLITYPGHYVHPKPSFDYYPGHTPTKKDLVVKHCKGIPALTYDKEGNRYLSTYQDNDLMKYRWIKYDDIHYLYGWSQPQAYAKDAKGKVKRRPQVALNPTNGKACWVWHTGKNPYDETKNPPPMVANLCLWSDTEWVHALDVGDVLQKEGSMKLYPNPAKEYVLINLPKEGNHEAVLYDMQGRIVVEVSFSGKEYKLNVQHLSKGAYMLKVVADTEYFVEKIIVE
ncbi:TapA/TapC family T9SS-dependent outer membrane protein [Porphyromonas gulae]|uniref:Secretion protein n=1 Tax=Porphyromonas gulae TaxID=111105 RepID=A0A0A2F8U4_9PORP|nr:T9SS type A sorting domain-containing protein [Porphyromonas gulae]KGN84839.1 secretion protein [Porphyromonas gulae]